MIAISIPAAESRQMVKNLNDLNDKSQDRTILHSKKISPYTLPNPQKSSADLK